MKKVKAIREIGLDYHWEDNPPKEHQKESFCPPDGAGGKLGLPVVVHDREAHGTACRWCGSTEGVRGVFHCYSGSLEDAKTLVKMGWMLSFTGVITYKNARRALEVLQWLPLDRVMIETDSPYLTPEPFRRERNDSSKVWKVAECIGKIKGISTEEAARITLENGKRFFNIP